MPSDRQRQTPTSPPTDSSEEVPGVIDAVRQLLAAIDRNPEYVAGILHGAAHRAQLDSLRNAIDRATDQAVVWQRPKGGGRQWHASNKAPPREPSPSAPATPSTSRTHQSTGASSSTHTAPPVVTPTMVPPNVTAVTWDQLQEMMGRMLDARLASTGSAASTTTGADGQTTEVQPEPAVQPEPQCRSPRRRRQHRQRQHRQDRQRPRRQRRVRQMGSHKPSRKQPAGGRGHLLRKTLTTG